MRAMRFVIAAVMLAATAGQANAALRLDYTITNLGPNYLYDFALVLDNADNSWAPGQGWNWIIFGDVPSATSPFSDFQLSPGVLPVGPFSSLNYSSGGHNGPTFLQSPGWIPTAVGETLYWSGTSASNLGQGQLKFSTLITSNGAVRADFQTANLVESLPPHGVVTPEPTSLALAGFAGIGMAAGAWRRRRQQKQQAA